MTASTEFNLSDVHSLLENYRTTGLENQDADRLAYVLATVPIFLGRVGTNGYIGIDDIYSGRSEYDDDGNRRSLAPTLPADNLFISMLQTPEGVGASTSGNVDLNRYYVDNQSGFKLKIMVVGDNKFTVIFSSNPVAKIQNLLGALTIVYNKTLNRQEQIHSAVKAVKDDVAEAVNHFADNADFSTDFDSPDQTVLDMIDYSNSLIDENGDFETNVLSSPEALETFSAETGDLIDSTNIKIVEELQKVSEQDAQVILNYTGGILSKMMSYIPDMGIANEVIKTIRQIDALRRAIFQLDQSLRGISAQAQVATEPPLSDEDKMKFIQDEIFPPLLDRDALVNGYQKSIRHLWNLVDMSTGLVPFMPDVLWRENNIVKIPENGLSSEELLVAAPILEMKEDKYLNPSLLGQALTKNIDDIIYVNLYDTLEVSSEDNITLLFADIFSFGTGDLTVAQATAVSDIASKFITKRETRLQIEDAFTPAQIEHSKILTQFASLGSLGILSLGNVGAYDQLADTIATAVIQRTSENLAMKGASSAAKVAGQGLLKVAGKVVSVLSTASFVNLIVLLYTFSKAISILIDSICKKKSSGLVHSFLCSYVLMPAKNIADSVTAAIEESAETAIRSTGKLVSDATPDSWKLALKIGVFGAVGIGLYALYKRTVPATQVAPAVVPRLMPVSPAPRAMVAQEFEYEDEAAVDDSWMPVSSDTEILMSSDSALRANAKATAARTSRRSKSSLSGGMSVVYMPKGNK